MPTDAEVKAAADAIRATMDNPETPREWAYMHLARAALTAAEKVRHEGNGEPATRPGT